MSEMIERVARAMSEASIPFGVTDERDDARRDAWDAMDEISRRHWRRYARAAIEAMRKPSEAMINAARAEMMMDPVRSANVFQVMIDAALAP